MNKIEEKYGLKPSHAYALFVILVLNIIWIVGSIVFYSRNILSHYVLMPFFMFAIAAFYACYGYKKPHGNHMRYLLILYAISVAIVVLLKGAEQSMLSNAVCLAIIILTTYMAGRLGHYKQNVIISIVVLALKCITTIYCLVEFSKAGVLTLPCAISCFGSITTWLAIAGAYITRYKLHKEAGFEDK